MAIKASATITISCYRDVEKIVRYYKLQASTAAAPAKPTTNPPNGWTDSEPSYTNGSTNTLYFCELNEYSDGTFDYSAVSKSSSYEAAKEAYNKAVAAGNTADNVQSNLNSYMKGNLIQNGFGEEKNNNNFVQWSFDGSETYENIPSFKRNSVAATVYIGDKKIPIDAKKAYEFSMNLKAVGTEKLYLGWDEYDIDGNYMSPTMQYAFEASTTTLAQDLKDGDTVVHLTSAAGWVNSTYGYQLGLIFWNYKDSTGYQYPVGVYSRNVWNNIYTSANVDKTNHTITLTSPWNHGTFPAGTKVSQTNSSGHKYFVYQNTTAPTEWTNVSWVIGEDGNPQELYAFSGWRFNRAAKFVQFMMLHNYGNSSSAATTYINNVRLVDKTLELEVDDAQDTADNAQDTADSAITRVAGAEQIIDGILSQISMLVTDANGTSLMTQTSDGWTFSTSSIDQNANDLSNKLNDLNSALGSTTGTVDALQQAVNDLSKTSDYVRIGTYENEPCIELGESDNDFKLMITNTRIMFRVGSGVPTYISNRGIVTENIEVEQDFIHKEFMLAVRENGNYGLSWNGNHNLIPDSKEITIGASSDNNYNYVARTSEEIATGTPYILTVESSVRNSGNATSFEIRKVTGTGSSASTSGTLLATVPIQNEPYSVFIPSQNSRQYLRIFAGLHGSTSGNSITINKIKLSLAPEGASQYDYKAPPWSPHPEDVG